MQVKSGTLSYENLGPPQISKKSRLRMPTNLKSSSTRACRGVRAVASSVVDDMLTTAETGDEVGIVHTTA